MFGLTGFAKKDKLKVEIKEFKNDNMIQWHRP